VSEIDLLPRKIGQLRCRHQSSLFPFHGLRIDSAHYPSSVDEAQFIGAFGLVWWLYQSMCLAVDFDQPNSTSTRDQPTFRDDRRSENFDINVIDGNQSIVFKESGESMACDQYSSVTFTYGSDDLPVG